MVTTVPSLARKRSRQHLYKDQQFDPNLWPERWLLVKWDSNHNVLYRVSYSCFKNCLIACVIWLVMSSLNPDLDKVKVIRNAPRPRTKNRCGNFLVFYWVLPQVCSKFAQIGVPLTDLGCPTNHVWIQSHDLAFQSLKCSLTPFHILKLPNI